MPCRLHPRDFVVYLHSYARALTALEVMGVAGEERDRRARAFAWARVEELCRGGRGRFKGGATCSADEASYAPPSPPSVASFFMGSAARGRPRPLRGGNA